MNITLISQYYWPESFGAGVWTAELAEWLSARGHTVSVITGFPNHPEGIIFPEYRGRVFQTERHNGVRIVRTWLYATPRTGHVWQRVLGQASFSLSLLMGSFSIPRPDVVWYASPPLPGAISAWILARLHGAALAMNISDLEPQRSVALQLFTNQKLIRLLRAIEKFSYRKADRICVLSQGTRQWLTAYGVAPDKVSITPNWANGELIRPLPQEMSLRSELGFAQSDFVVLYSGNMGYTMSDLHSVIRVARELAPQTSIGFVLAGDGVRRLAIEAEAAGLNNVTFLPIQSQDRYARLLAAADVCMVVLCREGTYASVPSKTYSIMAAGKPVLAICDAGNDIARVVYEADCGCVVGPGDVHALKAAIQRYVADRNLATEQGRRAREYFQGHYSPAVGMSTYEMLFEELVRGRTPHALVENAE